MTTCCLESWADPLGVLLLRGIDNHDSASLRRAKWILARGLSDRRQIAIIRANRTVRDVLVYLIDQRCETCAGQQFIRQDTSVRACPACDGAGLVGPHPPSQWSAHHRAVLVEAMGAMGRALATAREAAEPG